MSPHLSTYLGFLTPLVMSAYISQLHCKVSDGYVSMGMDVGFPNCCGLFACAPVFSTGLHVYLVLYESAVDDQNCHEDWANIGNVVHDELCNAG